MLFNNIAFYSALKNYINDNIIEVALIPHTMEHTNLNKKEIGDETFFQDFCIL